MGVLRNQAQTVLMPDHPDHHHSIMIKQCNQAQPVLVHDHHGSIMTKSTITGDLADLRNCKLLNRFPLLSSACCPSQLCTSKGLFGKVKEEA